MILWRTNGNYAKKSLRILSTVKFSRVQRCSRNARFIKFNCFSTRNFQFFTIKIALFTHSFKNLFNQLFSRLAYSLSGSRLLQHKSIVWLKGVSISYLHLLHYLERTFRPLEKKSACTVLNGINTIVFLCPPTHRRQCNTVI